MSNQLKRRNHYVPIWYQRGFLVDGCNLLAYLDLHPFARTLADGRVIHGNPQSDKALKSCFCQQDLYTTQFGTTLNDDIEHFLFGGIDDTGAIAVRAFVENNLSNVHKSFEDFFEFIDAQKLRTPKGLDWIRTKYPNLTQLELMVEMQGLRQMHCTMWSEGVREIVSAVQSDVKFIISDHPITIYNADLPPGTIECRYPNDPLIELIGSQTIFVLDQNHCLILTNLEYAKNPENVDLKGTRTNARYRGQSLVRTDAFIRSRQLKREDVVAINFVLKTRANKYIAAGNKDWLHPEREFDGTWSGIRHTMLPRDKLWQFGGEIYVGYKDGSTHYQDAFGRTSSQKHLEKKAQGELTPNDFCGCGSGRKFKKCCKGLPDSERPSWKVYSIRERNLMFCRAISNILGIQHGEKTWEDVRRDLTDEQVVRIHSVFASLWPAETDLATLLPGPDQKICRAVYFGTIDPRTVTANATSWLAYVDELILPHPFINPLAVKPEYSAIHSPSKHKEQTIKNVYLLLMLEPYIQAGYIHLIPDPADIDKEVQKAMMPMAMERTKEWHLEDKDMGQYKKLSDDDFERTIKRLPEKHLYEYLRQSNPELKSEQIEPLVIKLKEDLLLDPLALLQKVLPGEDGSQFMIIKGFNLEIAMYLAGLTGSVIYTDTRFHWEHLHKHTKIARTVPLTSAWTELESAAQSAKLPLDLNWQTNLDSITSGKSGEIRSVLRRIVAATQDADGELRASALANQLQNAALGNHKRMALLPSNTRFEGRMELSIPTGGFERNEVRRLQVTFGRKKNIRTIPLALFIHYFAEENNNE